MSKSQQVSSNAPRERVRNEEPIVLCCGTQGCPQAHVDRQLGMITLTDDGGGVVTLSAAEWQMAVQEVKF